MGGLMSNPNFVKWFGKSVVKDAEGAPLRVYHGTNWPGHDVFDMSQSDFGAHFSTTPEVASAFAREGAVYPVYLNIENPIRLKDHGYWSEFKIMDELRKQGILSDDEINTLTEQIGKVSPKVGEKARVLRDYLDSKGYDGIVYLNRREFIRPGESSMSADRWGTATLAEQKNPNMTDAEFKQLIPEASDAYIAFKPTQIKSAIGNRGTFSPNDPNILKGLMAPAAVTAASLYSPGAAQAKQYRNMAEQQALEEPTFDPTTLLAGPARWGGGLMNMIGDAVLRYLTK